MKISWDCRSQTENKSKKIMKLALIVFGLAALVGASVLPPVHHEVADKTFLQKQKAVIELLWAVTQPVVVPEILEVAKNYRIEEHVDHYTDVEAVKAFLNMYKYGTLPKEEVFTVFNQKHQQEAVALFNVFFYAKDFETFYKTACWARVFMNPGQFVFAFTSAVVHREDCNGVVLPAPYEIYPHLFVENEVIQKAYHAKFVKPTPSTDGEIEPVVITVNNTGFYPYYLHNTEKHSPEQWTHHNIYDYDVNVHPEHRLSYFTEDVAVNTYNYYFYMYNPFFMNTTYGYKPEGHGELFFWYNQQLLARYFLERLSNNLLDIDAVDMEKEIVYGYNPNLRYPNGKDFPVRPDNVNVQDYKTYEYELVEDFERRITDAIDFGFVYTPTGKKVSIYDKMGVDVLGQMVYSTVNSVNPKYYGKLYQLVVSLFGHIVDSHYNHDVAPGVIEHYETALRDPLYYRIIACITQLYYRYKNNMGPYHYEELVYPGVKISTVEVDKLVTFFENFEFDISSAVATGKIVDDLVVKARQYRLNHKPFTYKVNVVSDKAATVMVRVFLGPKYDVEGHVFDVNEKRKWMVEIDRFPQQIVVGENVVTRNSKDIFNTVEDYTSVRDLYKSVVTAIEGTTHLTVLGVDKQCGFPARFLLPKGKRGGMPFTFFVAVTPLTSDVTPTTWEQVTSWDVKYNGTVGCGNGLGLFPQDKYPMGFPFDKPIDVTTFYVPNFYEKEVVIFHKRADETTNVSV